MKLATLGKGGQGSGVLSESAITFEDNATSFYAQISGLAENKIGYPIRELVSNAWDASPRSVTVTLPSDENPMFSVRDHGPGLSHEFITGPFARMYFSDKRDDPNKVGGWGIGRFSAFGYLLSAKAGTFYMVSSWHEGMRRDYIVDLNADGRPVIKHMAEAPSDDPTGLEVRFMVLKKDFEEFRRQARAILWSFDPRPTVVSDPEIEWPKMHEVAHGTGWRRFVRWPEGFSMGPYLRMGPVAYPINMAHPDIKGHNSFVNTYTAVLFDVPIGSVRPTLSREDLAYDAQTCETIRTVFSRYSEEIEQSIASAIARSESYYTACAHFHEGTRFLPPEVRSRILQNSTWRDQPIREYINSTEKVRVGAFPKGWSRLPSTTYKSDGIFPNQCATSRVIVEHRPQYSMDKIEALGLIGQPLVWLRCSKEDLAEALAYIGCGPEYRVIDDTPVARTRDERPRNLRKRSLILLGPGGTTRVTETINLDERQVYIRICASRNYPSRPWEGYDGSYCEIWPFTRLVNSFQRLNWIRDRIVRCVALNPDSKVQENWISLAHYLVQVARENGFDMTVSPFARLDSTQIPAELRGLALMDRPLFERGGPRDLTAVCRQAWTIGQAAQVKSRQHASYSHHYERHEPLDTVKHDLAMIGYSSETTTALDTALGAIQALKTEFDRATVEHPLFRLACSVSGNNWHFGRRVSSDRDALLEYERILMKIPEYAGDPEDE